MGIEFNPNNHEVRNSKTEDNNIIKKQDVKPAIINPAEMDLGEQVFFTDGVSAKPITGKVELYNGQQYIVNNKEDSYKKSDGTTVTVLTKIMYDYSEDKQSPRFAGIRHFLMDENGEYKEINPRKNNEQTPHGI